MTCPLEIFPGKWLAKLERVNAHFAHSHFRYIRIRRGEGQN